MIIAAGPAIGGGVKQQGHNPVALAAAMALPESEGAPEWVHLLPAAQDGIQTYDGRGPYRVADIEAVIAASMQSDRGMPIDENHATDMAMMNGVGAPARGWIKELQARGDGLWGRVEWTKAGRKMLADHAYRSISPVFTHLVNGTITQILRASLTNKPNLRGLTALNTESTMDLTAIARALGLGGDADEAAILAAAAQLTKPAPTPALQSALDEIGTVLGVDGGDPAVVLAAAKAAKTGDTAITALQTELGRVTGQLTALQIEGAKAKATAFVDEAIGQGRVGVKPLRDHYIAMHCEDPARVEKEIGALPMLGPANTIASQPKAADGEIALHVEQLSAATVLGIDPKAYAATLEAERANKEAL